ncbi:cytosolic carboxypeptidase 1-like [Saccostrea echinata]|uniref:cytosolic carboxypeptidase 1-like n=1 Tax=Saccostrea echinata TaxID=191078 RepID=UPI002A80406E|nr:cytosolic carboxypeptidase 1-like [Saccostrea echinata]
MDRSLGSRLQTLFQQLEKIGGKQARNQTSTEDLQSIRYVTTKIYQILNSQDKAHRDTVIKNSGWIDLILATLKNTSDRAVLLNTIQILAEIVGKTQVGKRASVLVSANATNILFQLVYREAEDQMSTDETMMLAHYILGKLSQKDRKFATKARLNLVLLITLNLIKNNLYNFKNLQSLLQVFKAYTNNSVNASYLGKQNSIPPMFRVIQQCGRKHTAILKLALDILTNLTKSRNNAARTIGGEHVPHLLALYHEWHQLDTKHRHVSLRKAILNILKNITNLRSGRKALADANGIQVLYDSALEVIDCREMESLILLASVIMRKCCPRNKLPLDNLQSPFRQELPESDLYPTGQDGINDNGFNGNSPDSDNSSLEEDDDIDSDDERFKTEDHSEEAEDDASEAPEPYKRTPEDLRMYDNFFPELFEIEPQDDDEPSASIYIPTGNIDSYGTVPSEPEPRQPTLRMPTASSYSSSKSSGYSSLHYDTPDYESYGATRCDSATAINLKTGTSVFSLDGPLSQPVKAPPSAKPKQLLQKSNSSSSSSLRKQKGSKKMTKDKKKKSSSSLSSTASTGVRLNEAETEFCNALCITPFPSSSKEFDLDREGYSSDEEEMDQCLHNPIVFQELAGATKSVFRFEKLAYPDLVGGKSPPSLEGLYHRKFGVQRMKVFEDIDRMIHPEHVIDRVVYDVDTVVARASSAYSPSNANLSNRDQMRIGSRLEAGGSASLRFNSQFESGNLRKAIWVREFEYDLILNPDVNTNHHHQWFYFEVSNMIADVPYRFNIVNCEKLNSQFNFGMKPVMFSVTEAMDGKPYWLRKGSTICYYKNHFTRSAQATGGVKGKTYYTATFTMTFKHDKDICYLAYHYPYTYTTLQTHLNLWEQYLDHTQIFFRKQTLCNTITGNGVPVLTITAQPKSLSKDFVDDLRSRPYIFLSGRVHPGESNSSWVMKGTIDFLLSKRPAAQLLRETYIFKIVPMLNPDGVINGCHRCSTAAEDLNRRWDNPCPKLHPTIYHAKGLLQYMQMIGKVPMVFCDYHGHSRRKNIFIYGCCPTLSYIQNDTKNPACTGNKTEDNSFKTLPRILHLTSPVFSWQNCSFVVEKAKETTARVVVWRQIGVIRSYTMESSYCGIDKDGKFKDQHISTFMLEEMGQKFCEGLLRLKTRYSGKDQAVSLPFMEGGNSSNEPTQESGSDELLAEADEDINLPDEQILYGAEDEEYDEDDEDEMYEEDETYDDDRN